MKLYIIPLIMLLMIATVYAIDVPSGGVKIIHSDCTETDYNSDNLSDISRGTALLTAVANIITGDQLYLDANGYDVGENQIDLSKGHTVIGVGLHGKGKYLTTIHNGSAGGFGMVVLIVTPDNSVLSDFTGINYGPDRYVWGDYYTTDPALPFHNVTLENLNLISDYAIMIETTAPSTAQVYNIDINTISSHEGIHMETTGSVLNIFNSRITVVGTGSGITHGLVAYLGRINAIDVNVNVSGSTGGFMEAGITVSDGQLYLYGGNYNAEFSLYNQGGFIGVDPFVIYDATGGDISSIASNTAPIWIAPNYSCASPAGQESISDGFSNLIGGLIGIIIMLFIVLAGLITLANYGIEIPQIIIVAVFVAVFVLILLSALTLF